MNRNLFILFSVILFAGILVPAYAQTADHVVINEVDTNPIGDDSTSISEWVELLRKYYKNLLVLGYFSGLTRLS